MYFVEYKAHAVPYFLSSHCLPLNLLYFKSVAAVLMHDISNNFIWPPNIANLFISKVSIHSHNASSSSRGDCFVKPSRHDKLIKSFSRNGVKIWNSLPCEICHLYKKILKLKSTTSYSNNFQKKMTILTYLS